MKDTFLDRHQLYRWENGIKLVSPDDRQSHDFYGQNTGYTVASVLALPFNFYFLDQKGNTQIMNEESALICGFQSAEDSIGKSLFDVSLPDSANRLIENCTYVMQAQVVNIFEEEHQKKDGTSLHFLSIKCPWYSLDNTIIGIFGCSIVLGQHNLASSLSIVIALGLFESDKSLHATKLEQLDVKLTSRELDCFRFAIKGWTAKKIAKELGISHRTVEEYIVNIRNKTGATSKAQLLEMFR